MPLVSQNGESALEFAFRSGDASMVELLSRAAGSACAPASGSGGRGEGSGKEAKAAPGKRSKRAAPRRAGVPKSQLKKAKAAAKRPAKSTAGAAAASKAARVSIVSAVANNLLDDARLMLDEGESPDHRNCVSAWFAGHPNVPAPPPRTEVAESPHARCQSACRRTESLCWGSPPVQATQAWSKCCSTVELTWRLARR